MGIIGKIYQYIEFTETNTSLDRRCDKIRRKCPLPFEDVIDTVKYIFKNTFFTFKGKVYQQILGSPMGSFMSPLFANLVMNMLETECLAQLDYQQLFYLRYVDDILLCIPKEKVNYSVNIFNRLSSIKIYKRRRA